MTTRTKATLIGVLVGGAVITGLVLSQRRPAPAGRAAVASRRAPARARTKMSTEKRMRREVEHQARRARLAYE